MGFSFEFTMNVSFEVHHTSFSSKLKDWFLHFNVLCVLDGVGWVGDSLLGRYQAIIAGFFY